MRKKSEFSQEVLRKLLIGGAVLVAAQSPYFWLKVYKKLFQKNPSRKKQISDAFSYLKKKGLILIEERNKQIYISLTEEGEKEAGKFQINKLKINSQQKWDKKWRIIIFDIPEKLRIKRDAFRGKLKELSFYPLQKSVWIYPYPCEKEIELLREFFGLFPQNLRILEVEKIEEDKFLKKIFNINEN